ncbi:MAG: hypothetical protein OWU33_10265 [Firmicutes bacterium]|nr:hypothetical protein [Bacillota bacterium]
MSRTVALFAAGVLAALSGASHPGATVAPRREAFTKVVKLALAQPLSSKTLVLSPASGPPGTRVTVEGYVPAVKTMTEAQRQKLPPVGNIQFGGLNQGLDIEGAALTWSAAHPGEYTMTFRVPTVPWLTLHGEHPLTPGRYAVTVTCVGPIVMGCALGPAEASGTFTLTGPIKTVRKAPFLHFSPDRGAPGTLIHVTGWAPLTTIIGQPFGYQLVWNPKDHASPATSVVQLRQSLTGSIAGTFQVPPNVNPLGSLRVGKNFLALSYVFTRSDASITPLAPTPFTILSPATWASLGRFRPLSVVTNQGTASFGLPSPVTANGPTVAVATLPGVLWMRSHNVWRSVSLKPIAALSTTTGYPAVYNGGYAPSASSITLVKGYPGSLFIAVSAAKAAYRSVPPVYNTPYYSTNYGKTWHVVPIPSGYTVGAFGGYTTVGSTVIAYFAHGQQWVGEVTANGGRSWTTVDENLPSTLASSLLFGPMANGNFGQMGPGNTETLLRRNARGHWGTSASLTNMTGTTTLARISAHEALLMEPQGEYPLQVTHNGGKTWTYVALPPIPGALPGSQVLGMFTNGTVIEQAAIQNQTEPAWFILKPGSSRWVHVPASILPPNTFGVTISGADLWWVANTGTATRHPTLAMVGENQL